MSPIRGTHRFPSLAAALLSALLALSACDSEAGRAKARTANETGTPLVVAPGRPGEPARTLSADEARRAVPDNRPNAADLAYARMMIVHHRQALEMTALAPGHAAGERLKRLAERIDAAQRPEIGAMEAWLKANGGGTDGGHGSHGQGGHDHGAMPGMATPAQLTQLRAAHGAAFDKLFLTLMITHHAGAVTMATEVLSNGRNVQMEEMASEVIAQQTAEINRMRAM
ncbi:DUF305 domain-containing protein [Streptomyces sp. NPDC127084]|uniref:DUF305 domain-containing protein n=1 Tax=Streptomyces sp. NPDC127084 TaxID=3347133 RepID=UPI0036623369